MLFAAVSSLLLPKYSSYLLSGASKLSPQQEHQREQVNHLALTSGADTFSVLAFYSLLQTFAELMWNLFGLKEVLCEDFWNVTLCFLINFTFVRRRCILRNILWILKMHSCQRCDLWPTKVWCQHHQGQSGLSFIIQFPMLWRHFFNYIFHFQNGRFQK